MITSLDSIYFFLISIGIGGFLIVLTILEAYFLRRFILEHQNNTYVPKVTKKEFNKNPSIVINTFRDTILKEVFTKDSNLYQVRKISVVIKKISLSLSVLSIIFFLIFGAATYFQYFK